MALPVVFIHQGNSRYLLNSFYQVKKTNPDSAMYLIGTKESKVYAPFVKHIDIYTYFTEAAAFEKIYQHFSTNSYEFELICLQRWFVLKEFLIANNIQECLYLDSDVLVYDDINVLQKKIGNYQMTITGISGHTNFLKLSALTDFCNFITESYSTPAIIKGLGEEYHAYVAQYGVGCISDMNFFKNYQQKYPQKVLNLKYFSETAVFDSALPDVDRYVAVDGIKKVVLENDVPYCVDKNTNARVLHYSLHFQGSNCKKIMQDFVIKKDIAFYLYKLYFDGVYFAQKVKKMLFSK